jgi:hypothetical protein
MNERIRALAEKANIEFTYDPTETPVRAFVECWEDELEKFAELIVRECLTVINQSNGVGDDDVIRISDDVKRHFGVEE